MTKQQKGIFYLLLVIIITFFSLLPLLQGGFFPMHDDTQPARVYEMAKALSYGQFPVRLVPDLGYGLGYPIFNFYAPLPYYLGAFFYLMGLSAIDATKIMFAKGIILSGITMFLLGKELFGELGGLISSTLYIYAPYHAVNIYIRGAVGEFYAYAFLPLIVLGIILIFKSMHKREFSIRLIKGGCILSIGLALTLLSHNILGFISSFFLIIFIFSYIIFLLIKKESVKVFRYISFFLILGFGLSSFFTIPALVEKKYTKVDELTTQGSDFTNHFVYFDQLWNSPWGFAGSAPGKNDGMSFKIGKIHLYLGFLSTILFLFLSRCKRLDKNISMLFLLYFAICIISIFFMLEQSKFIWKILPGFAFIQYPWRFLNFTLFGLSSMAGILVFPFKNKWKFFLTFILIDLIILVNNKYFTPKEYLAVTSADYISKENLINKISRISDEYLPKELVTKNLVDNSLFTQQVYQVITETPTEKKYSFYLEKPDLIILKIAYFPGWKAFVNNSPAGISNQKGLIGVYLRSGWSTLTLKFFDTPIRVVSNAISLLSLFLLVYLSLFWKKNNLWPRKNL